MQPASSMVRNATGMIISLFIIEPQTYFNSFRNAKNHRAWCKLHMLHKYNI